MKALIQTLLSNAVEQVVTQQRIHVEHPIDVHIERPRDPEHGDFSSNVAMLLTKIAKMPPRTIAEYIIQAFPEHSAIASIEIAGPGFINIRLSNNHIAKAIDTLWLNHCGIKPIHPQHTVVIDYSSPNLAKEMHVGHLRSTIIGDALARIMELKGYHVVRQNHVGDWGTQFGMLIAHLDEENKTHPGSVELNDLESFYKMAKQRFDMDPDFADRARQWVVLLQSNDAHCKKLWNLFIQLSLAHCQTIYQRLGVNLHEKDVRAESAYNNELPHIVTQLQDKGLLREHDGAQCVFLEAFKGKDGQTLPIIVQKRDGGYLYATTDLAAIDYRCHTIHADRVLYVVDARQALHFQQIFALAHKAGFATSKTQLEHISFGMVLDKQGKPFKSREGGVTKLATLLDEAEKRAKILIAQKSAEQYPEQELEVMAHILGMAAIKYADLSKNRVSDYIFDWDSMLSFEGNTAPYLLYAYTRIQRIFEKAQCNMDSLSEETIQLLTTQDLSLAKHLLQYPETIDMVVDKAMPHLLCTYLYELAGTFSSFYESCPILNQEDLQIRNSRLKLAALTAKILEQGLHVLGIQTLKRM